MKLEKIDEYQFPWLTEFGWIFLIFVAALITFHFTLIRKSPLSSVQWKQVDYVWLLMALIGMLGTVGSARELIANNLLDLANHRRAFSYQTVESRLQFGTSEAICRKFERSEFSPPGEEFDRLQNEYDLQCKFFQRAVDLLKAKAAHQEPLDLIQLFGQYPIGGDQQVYENLRDATTIYNENLEVVATLQEKAQVTELESFMRLVGPLLIALALALRMTKVTAEVVAEKKKGLDLTAKTVDNRK